MENKEYICLLVLSLFRSPKIQKYLMIYSDNLGEMKNEENMFEKNKNVYLREFLKTYFVNYSRFDKILIKSKEEDFLELLGEYEINLNNPYIFYENLISISIKTNSKFVETTVSDNCSINNLISGDNLKDYPIIVIKISNLSCNIKLLANKQASFSTNYFWEITSILVLSKKNETRSFYYNKKDDSWTKFEYYGNSGYVVREKLDKLRENDFLDSEIIVTYVSK